MAASYPAYNEPIRATLLRTSIIALVVGAFLAARAGGVSRWPAITVLALWFSLGGHFVELLFLNWLRPRLPDQRLAHIAARLATWCAGGIVLGLGMALTARLLVGIHPPVTRVLTFSGPLFIGIELVVHLVLQLRGRPNFFNGQG